MDDLTDFTITTKSRKKVSFAGIKHIKEFVGGKEHRWGETYEQELTGSTNSSLELTEALPSTIILSEPEMGSTMEIEQFPETRDISLEAMTSLVSDESQAMKFTKKLHRLIGFQGKDQLGSELCDQQYSEGLIDSHFTSEDMIVEDGTISQLHNNKPNVCNSAKCIEDRTINLVTDLELTSIVTSSNLEPGEAVASGNDAMMLAAKDQIMLKDRSIDLKYKTMREKNQNFTAINQTCCSEMDVEFTTLVNLLNRNEDTCYTPFDMEEANTNYNIGNQVPLNTNQVNVRDLSYNFINHDMEMTNVIQQNVDIKLKKYEENNTTVDKSNDDVTSNDVMNISLTNKINATNHANTPIHLYCGGTRRLSVDLNASNLANSTILRDRTNIMPVDVEITESFKQKVPVNASRIDKRYFPYRTGKITTNFADENTCNIPQDIEFTENVLTKLSGTCMSATIDGSNDCIAEETSVIPADMEVTKSVSRAMFLEPVSENVPSDISMQNSTGLFNEKTCVIPQNIEYTESITHIVLANDVIENSVNVAEFHRRVVDEKKDCGASRATESLPRMSTGHDGDTVNNCTINKVCDENRKDSTFEEIDEGKKLKMKLDKMTRQNSIDGVSSDIITVGLDRNVCKSLISSCSMDDGSNGTVASNTAFDRKKSSVKPQISNKSVTEEPQHEGGLVANQLEMNTEMRMLSPECSRAMSDTSNLFNINYNKRNISFNNEITINAEKKIQLQHNISNITTDIKSQNAEFIECGACDNFPRKTIEKNENSEPSISSIANNSLVSECDGSILSLDSSIDLDFENINYNISVNCSMKNNSIRLDKSNLEDENLKLCNDTDIRLNKLNLENETLKSCNKTNSVRLNMPNIEDETLESCNKTKSVRVNKTNLADETLESCSKTNSVRLNMTNLETESLKSCNKTNSVRLNKTNPEGETLEACNKTNSVRLNKTNLETEFLTSCNKTNSVRLNKTNIEDGTLESCNKTKSVRLNKTSLEDETLEYCNKTNSVRLNKTNLEDETLEYCNKTNSVRLNKTNLEDETLNSCNKTNSVRLSKTNVEDENFESCSKSNCVRLNKTTLEDETCNKTNSVRLHKSNPEDETVESCNKTNSVRLNKTNREDETLKSCNKTNSVRLNRTNLEDNNFGLCSKTDIILDENDTYLDSEMIPSETITTTFVLDKQRHRCHLCHKVDFRAADFTELKFGVDFNEATSKLNLTKEPFCVRLTFDLDPDDFHFVVKTASYTPQCQDLKKLPAILTMKIFSDGLNKEVLNLVGVNICQLSTRFVAVSEMFDAMMNFLLELDLVKSCYPTKFIDNRVITEMYFGSVRTLIEIEFVISQPNKELPHKPVFSVLSKIVFGNTRESALALSISECNPEKKYMWSIVEAVNVVVIGKVPWQQFPNVTRKKNLCGQ